MAAEGVTTTIASDPELDGLILQVLITPEGRADPYPHYARMHERADVWRTSFGPLVVVGYDDALAVLRDHRLGRGAPGDGGPFDSLTGTTGRRAEFFDLSRHNMLLADPPDHTRLRKLVSRAFTPKQMERLRPTVQRLVDQLIDEMLEAREVDFLRAFALPLPMAVIGELVGVPEADWNTLQPMIRAIAKGIEPILSEEEVDEAVRSMTVVADYFMALLEDRRRHPTDDLLSGLVEARERDDQLSDLEVCSTAILLFSAGFETTTNLLGNGLYALLHHPDQLARWRVDVALGETAVEELVRWDSPVQLNVRAALEPVEFMGEQLDAGQRLIILQGAANHDPARYDHPEVLDLGRKDNIPVSFGFGAHYCLGAALARLEANMAFATLLARCPSIEPVGDEPEWRASFTLRGLVELPITLS